MERSYKSLKKVLVYATLPLILILGSCVSQKNVKLIQEK
jgi:hypothetical protein